MNRALSAVSPGLAGKTHDLVPAPLLVSRQSGQSNGFKTGLAYGLGPGADFFLHKEG